MIVEVDEFSGQTGVYAAATGSISIESLRPVVRLLPCPWNTQPSNPEFASERAGSRHEPRTMRLFLGSHHSLIEIRNWDDGSLGRYGASSGDLRIMRLRPFPEPARRTTHRDTHDWHPFLNCRK
jgi:hypothetical protein